MKKILCLVLTTMLLLSCSALAEEKEITFQGIPWRCSIQEMGKVMLEKKLIKEGSEHTARDNFKPSSWLDWNGITYLTNDNGIGYFRTPLSGDTRKVTGHFDMVDRFMEEDTKIAGYEVGKIDAAFARYENDKSELLSFCIFLMTENGEEAFNDLTAKLSTLYGEPESHVFTPDPLFGYLLTSNVAEKTINAWKGANNTAVLLFPGNIERANGIYSFNTPSQCVSLIYGTLDAQAILDAYYAEYQANNQPEPVDSMDVSGL